MLPESTAIADEYWAAELGCNRAALRSQRPHLQQHAGGLRDYGGVYVLTLASAPLVSVPASLFEAVAPRFSQFHTKAIRDPEILTRLLAPGIVTKVVGPALLHYGDRSCFNPTDTAHTRELTPKDDRAFTDLRAACSPEDWDPKGFVLDGKPTFGAFTADGVLMAVANVRIWADRIAHLSVVTRPGARNQGYGSRAVAATTERALDMGLLPQYRVLENNFASLRVAHKLGFQSYGWSLAARLAP